MKKFFTAILGLSLLLTPIQAKASQTEIGLAAVAVGTIMLSIGKATCEAPYGSYTRSEEKIGGLALIGGIFILPVGVILTIVGLTNK